MRKFLSLSTMFRRNKVVYLENLFSLENPFGMKLSYASHSTSSSIRFFVFSSINIQSGSAIDSNLPQDSPDCQVQYSRDEGLSRSSQQYKSLWQYPSLWKFHLPPKFFPVFLSSSTLFSFLSPFQCI